MNKPDESQAWADLTTIEREIIEGLLHEGMLHEDTPDWRQLLANEAHLNRDEVATAVAHAQTLLLRCVDAVGREGTSAQALAAKLAARHRIEADIVRRNLPLVHFFAQRYAPRYEHDDLFQEGCLGLLRAVQKFEPWRGVRFSTYASLWIRQAMQRAVGQKAPTVRVPVHQLDRRRMVGRVIERHRARSGSQPSPEEIAHELACSVDDVASAHAADVHVQSIDVPDGGGLDHWVHDEQRSPEDAIDLREQAALVRSAVACLAIRDRVIIESRFGIDTQPSTLSEIGHELGLSRERVRQLEHAALERLRLRVVDREASWPRRSQAW